MDKRTFKDSVYAEVASLSRALSNPHRIEILDLLANGEKSVDQIARETSLTFANASQHLQQLKKSRLVRIRREKNYIYYNLGNPYVYAVWKTLREFSRYHIPEIDRTVSEFHQARNVRSITLRDLPDFRPYTLVDVRPRKEFDLKHIEGAIHLEADMVASNLHRLDMDNAIITYCRGPFCTLASEAAEILQKNGFTTFRLEESALDA